MSRYRSDSQCKLYVGDLARDTTEKDLERAFSYYGRIRSVWVARNPAGFGFVEYEDRRDADDAVHGLDGSTVCGAQIRVEHSSERPKSRFRGGGRGGGGGGFRGGGGRGGRRPFNPDDRCYQCGEPGHYAYDCTNSQGSSRRGGGGSSYGRSRSSRYSRSRSRSRSRSYKRSYSRSRSGSRKRYRSSSRSSSRTPPRKGGD